LPGFERVGVRFVVFAVAAEKWLVRGEERGKGVPGVFPVYVYAFCFIVS
jgi:hypothetical protein